MLYLVFRQHCVIHTCMHGCSNSTIYVILLSVTEKDPVYFLFCCLLLLQCTLFISFYRWGGHQLWSNWMVFTHHFYHFMCSPLSYHCIHDYQGESCLKCTFFLMHSGFHYCLLNTRLFIYV